MNEKGAFPPWTSSAPCTARYERSSFGLTLSEARDVSEYRVGERHRAVPAASKCRVFVTYSECLSPFLLVRVELAARIEQSTALQDHGCDAWGPLCCPCSYSCSCIARRLGSSEPHAVSSLQRFTCIRRTCDRHTSQYCNVSARIVHELTCLHS